MLLVFILLKCVCIAQYREMKSTLSIGVKPFFAIHKNNIQYSISGNIDGTSPNILSDLSWKNVNSAVYGGEITAGINHFSIEGRYSYGTTYGGDVSDIDYAEDNRNGVFSEQYLSSNIGTIKEIRIFPAYHFFRRSHISLLAYPAFQVTKQLLYLVNKVTKDHQDYIDDLQSSYQYNSRVVGAGLKMFAGWDKFSLVTRVNAGKLFYEASGNWNLRRDLEHPVSYSHKARGKSIAFEIENRYHLTKSIICFFEYSFLSQKSRKGVDKLFRQDKEPYETLLNETARSQYAFQVGIILLTTIN